ncbi:response regulator [Clostridium amazonitimonense]|uniref:response regulator n=1 Tax=Clostridium amazonitimonense TaxID=1499689 RepID=UPI000509E778|nr:response regulator [Clostridium amazonitimonense]
MIRVMILEDDPMVRDINSKFICKINGFQLCAEAGNLKDGMELLIKHKPDLLLLDVFFPKGTGLEFLKWIRKEEIKCDAILITAESGLEAIQEAFRYGAVDYLVKPFTFQRFKEALNQYRSRYDKFSGITTASQQTIDEYILIKQEISKEEEGIAKGLNYHTYSQIWDYIIENKKEPFTAEELSENIGMARVTVRRYLEHMLKEGKLELELEYGKIGRPCHKYKQVLNF